MFCLLRPGEGNGKEGESGKWCRYAAIVSDVGRIRQKQDSTEAALGKLVKDTRWMGKQRSQK